MVGLFLYSKLPALDCPMKWSKYIWTFSLSVITSCLMFGCSSSHTSTRSPAQQSVDNSTRNIVSGYVADDIMMAEDFFNRGMIYYYQHFYDEAIHELNQSLRYDTTAGQLYFLGMCYKHKSRPGKASAAFSQALVQDSLHQQSLVELIAYHSGAEHRDTLELILTTYVHTYGITPQLLEYGTQNLYSLFPQETLAVVRQHVGSIRARNTLFEIVAIAEHIQDSDLYLQVLTRLLTLTPRNRELVHIFFESAFALNKLEYIANNPQLISRLSPSDQRESAELLLSLLHSKVHDLDYTHELQDICMQLVGLRDHSIRGRALFALAETGNNNLALFHFERLSASHPDIEIYKYGIAEVCHRTEQWERSISAYKSLEHTSSKNNAFFRNAFAYTLACANVRVEKADSLIDLALAEVPGNLNFMDTKAWVMFRLGHVEDARMWIDQCINNKEASAEMFAHAAEIYAHLNLPEQATFFIKRAIEMQPNHSTWRQLQETLLDNS